MAAREMVPEYEFSRAGSDRETGSARYRHNKVLLKEGVNGGDFSPLPAVRRYPLGSRLTLLTPCKGNLFRCLISELSFYANEMARISLSTRYDALCWVAQGFNDLLKV